MKIIKFEDLMVWRKSVDLTINIYSSMELINDFGLKNQIQRASLSISNNIAEGFERGSDRDFKRFLYIAQGSCSEVKSMLYVAIRLNYLKKESFIMLNRQVTEIGKMLYGLSNSLSDGSTRNFRNPKLND
jgi:four helix bundle protein